MHHQRQPNRRFFIGCLFLGLVLVVLWCANQISFLNLQKAIVNQSATSSPHEQQPSIVDIDGQSIQEQLHIEDKLQQILEKIEQVRKEVNVKPQKTTPKKQTAPRAPTMLTKTSKKMERILLTGGGGFIGYHASKAFLKRGDLVFIVDEMNDYYDVTLKQSRIDEIMALYGPEQVQFFKGDIANITWMRGIFENTQPTSIVHLAARAGVRPSIEDPFVYVHSNVMGTTAMLVLAHEYNIPKVVYASSSSVYGGNTNEYFSETDLVDFPVSPYAATKKSCELIAYTFHHLYGFDTIGLRFFTVYGPSGRPDMAPFKFIDRIAKGVPIQRYGDGQSSRDYTFVDDIVDGIVRSLDYGRGYQVFNLGNGQPTYLNDFIGMIETLLNKTAVIEVLPDQPGDVPRTCANITLAKRLLGYKPRFPLADGLKQTVAWYLNYYQDEEKQQEFN